jgi:cystathionine beta-lyase
MKQDTTIVKAGRHPENYHGAINPPVYRASTFLADDLATFEERRHRRGQLGFISYGRFGTPTTFALQEAMTELEGGYASVTAGSGLNAITTAMMAFLKPGDHTLVVDSVYKPTRMLCDDLLAPLGVETTYYDPLVGADIAALIRAETKVVFLESPGSLTFEMQDVPAIAAAAHDHGATVLMDNTWASPYFFKPLAHGVDVSIQAATKYIVGHSDAIVGTITTTEAAWPAVEKMSVLLGSPAGTEECYLAQRGFRTLALRMERHQETGIALARWLADRPEVARILHPALPDDPGHDLWRRDFGGASGLFGVVLKESYAQPALAAMIDGLEHLALGASWGGYESLLVPMRPEEHRSATKWEAPGTVLRIHAGLEDPDDLMTDLDRGFERLKKAS